MADRGDPVRLFACQGVSCTEGRADLLELCASIMPRRSIDVAGPERNSNSAAGPGRQAALEASQGANASSDGAGSSPSARLSRTYSAKAPTGPMTSGPTPAEYLTSDGRLDVSSMMEHSSHSQSSNHLKRTGSIRFSKAASRSSFSESQRKTVSSPKPASQPSSKCVSDVLGSPTALQRSRSVNDSSACSAAGNGSELLPELTQQQQQLAVACQSKDLKLLQQVLAVSVPASAALDSIGNTALHLLLLPAPTVTPALRHTASLQHVPSEGSLTSSVTKTNTTGPFGWLTACFNGSSTSTFCGSSSLAASRSAQPSLRGRAAAAAANASMVSALLSANADVNVRNCDGLTPIMLAVQQLVSLLESSSSSGKIAAAMKVLDALCKHPMADMNMKDPQGRTALALLMLPSAGTCFISMDCDAAAAAAVGRESSVGGASAVTTGSAASASLTTTAAAAHLRVVQLLIHCGADINAADHSGMTILMHAAAQPAVTKELLQLLLESGANPLLLDNKRRSALTHALVAQQLKLQPALGPGYEKWQQSVAAHRAAGSASYSSSGVKQMGPTSASSFAGVAAGAGHDGGDAGGVPGSSNCSTPASISDEPGGNLTSSNSSSASQQEVCMKPQYSAYVNPFPLPSHGSVIRALCSYGSLDLYPGSINTRFPAIDGYSQLHIAMRRGDPRAQELLLAGGADVNALDTWGNSPLMYWPVAPTSPPELVETLVAALLRHGADPNLANNDGWTPLDLACDLDKIGKVHVKPKCVPVHALLVGYGAKNSDAFMNQHRHQPTMMCLRTDSANSVLRVSRSYDSLRVVVPSVADTADLMSTTAVLEEP